LKINSNNEWGKLRSIVVGTAVNANFPTKDIIYTKSMEGGAWKKSPPPSGPPIEQVIEETEEDLDLLIHTLDRFAVSVYRPDIIDFTKTVSTVDWETDGQFAYCPRDTHLVIGDIVIETPMHVRARQHEAIAMDKIRRMAIKDGARWISAPAPRLLDSENIVNGTFMLNEHEPVFDAANVCRVGNDLIYLVSSSGNRIGAKWLQNVLGNEYNVHVCENLYNSAHIDSTIVPISNGTVVLNANRINSDNLPSIFNDWDKIYVNEEDVIPRDFHEYPYASKWIGINMLAINPTTVIVDEIQTKLITTLEKKNFTVVPLPLRHSRTLGGGFHCVTLDLEREDD
jgi:N-dimethylarginine dimethylaminohydrolase